MAEALREFRAETYAVAAQEHVTAAVELHEAERFALAHYIAGLAVECVLRAFKSRLDPVLDERHDLYQLAKGGRFFDRVSEKHLPDLLAAFGEVVARWDKLARTVESALRKFLVQRRLFSGKETCFRKQQPANRKCVLAGVSFGAQTWKNCIKRLRQLLERVFPGATVELEVAAPEKVGGFLIWNGFDQVDQVERQRRLWTAIRGELSREDQLRITAILTLTPDERSVPSES